MCHVADISREVLLPSAVKMTGEDKVFRVEMQTSTYGTRTPLKIDMLPVAQAADQKLARSLLG
jgi:hypothetical protein